MPQTAPQQANPPPMQQQLWKRKRVAEDPLPESDPLTTDQPPPNSAMTIPIPQSEKATQGASPASQVMGIRSHVASTSTFSSRWECTF